MKNIGESTRGSGVVVARVTWPARLGALALTFLSAWFLVAPPSVGMLEGVKDGFTPAIPAALFTLAIGLLALAAGVLRVKRPVDPTTGRVRPAWLFKAVAKPTPEADQPTNRRGFLATAGALGASGLAASTAGIAGFLGGHRHWGPVANKIFIDQAETTAPKPHPEWQGSTVQNYRRLGRTEAMVSDISLGSGRIKSKKIAIDAIDRGVNYFDTAPDYSDTQSERILGEAILETRGRDKMFLASKFCTADGHLPQDAPVPQIIEAVEGSLQRLNTDYLDLIHIHSCDTVDRLMAPNFHEAFDRLREQGKARFLGVSTHTPNLAPVARQAIASDRFDVIMLAYHYGLFPEIGQVMDEAHARDVGVVAMKTLKGAKATNLVGLDEAETSYAQAAFRWVLANPSVSCLVVSFFNEQHCDEYLYASGTSPRPSDQAVLESYDRLASADYCRPHCGACLDSCEKSLPINTVLRYDMYFENYVGRKEVARGKYAKLAAAGIDASSCESCPAPCAGSCPFELPIRAKMVRAHERLQRT